VGHEKCAVVIGKINTVTLKWSDWIEKGEEDICVPARLGGCFPTRTMAERQRRYLKRQHRQSIHQLSFRPARKSLDDPCSAQRCCGCECEEMKTPSKAECPSVSAMIPVLATRTVVDSELPNGEVGVQIRETRA